MYQLLSCRRGNKAGCPLSPLCFNMVVEFLASSIMQKRNNRNRDRKGRRKPFLFVGGMVIYLENLKESIFGKAHGKSKFSKVTG